MANVAKDFAQLISQSKSNKTGPYDTQATVKRVEGNTVWVSIPGGVDETPIDKTVNCTAGDKVQVRVSGGRAWITGNASAPPTDDATAIKARTTANEAQVLAVDAKETADAVEGIAQAAQHSADTAAHAAAQAVLDAAAASSAATAAQSSADNASEYAARALGNLSTVQSVAETLTWITAHGTMTLTTDVTPDPTHVYFVVDAGGDYTVGGTTYSIVTEPVTADMSTYYELSIDESLNNYVATHLSVTSEGLWIIPDAGGNKVLIATGSGSTYTAAGTYIVGAGNVVLAKFLASGTTIGVESGAHTTLDTDGQTVYKDATNAIAHIGVGSFPDPDDPQTYIRGSYYTFGERTGQIGIGSLAHGDGTEASGDYSVSMGVGCVASGEGAVAIGEFSRATGEFSFAHGIDDNGYALASGRGSHAEGTSTASGNVAHSEGRGARAIGNNSHAEGVSTVARGAGSHAGGFETEAQGAYQTAIGKLNVKDSTSAFIIGCGKYEDDNPIRKNALTVDWSGNVEADGDIEDGSGNVLADKADTSSLATVATSGSYNDLTNKPTIPTKTSDLTNDSRFISANSSGNVSLSGSITTGGHNNPIGYTTGNNTGTWSVTNASETNVPSANLTPLSLTPGVWIVFAQADFSSNATGRRFIEITTSSSGHITRSGVMQNAVSGGATKMVTTAYLNLTNTQTVTIRVFQNSGAARSTTFNISAVRIA